VTHSPQMGRIISRGMANLFQLILERMGYCVYRYQEPPKPDPSKRYNTIATRYTHRAPFPWKTYSPWFDRTFLSVYDGVRGVTLIPEDRCYYIYHLAEYCAHLGGTMAECGVYRGGSAYFIALALERSQSTDRHLHLFDTFSGMPAKYISKNDPHKPNEFSRTSLAEVRAILADYSFVEFHPGTIPETFSSIEESTRFSFVHLDVDLYRSNKSCCEYFYGRMITGGVLLFDEYGFEGYEFTERLAIDEFFKDKPEHPFVLPTG